MWLDVCQQYGGVHCYYAGKDVKEGNREGMVICQESVLEWRGIRMILSIALTRVHGYGEPLFKMSIPASFDLF
jgi:hypothetical protein